MLGEPHSFNSHITLNTLSEKGKSEYQSKEFM